jgi:hypothetical protein
VGALPSLQGASLEICDPLSDQDCTRLAAAPRLAALHIVLQQVCPAQCNHANCRYLMLVAEG